MISYNRSSSGSRVILGLVVVAAVGAGAWWWMSGDNAPAAPGVVLSASQPVAHAASQAFPDQQPAAAEGDFSPADMVKLNQAMGNQANGQQELKRVSTFLRFQRDFERWQSMMEATDPAPRHALANQLVDALPERVKQAEVTLPEAELMCAMLLNDLEPNEAARTQKNETCKQRLEAVSPKTDTEQGMRAAQCQTEYRRREAALVSEFQAKPAAQRNPHELETELDKAKHAVFDSPNCGR
jgi:hypothetical protein